LVDEGVERDGGLAGLAVADDQLALAATDGHERIEGLEAGLHRLVHRLPRDDARRLDLRHGGASALRSGPLPSIGLPSASTTRPSRPLPTGTSTMVPVRLAVRTFLDLGVRAEDHDADVVGFEV
jgi:hypothetical protein